MQRTGRFPGGAPDVFTGQVLADRSQMISEYRETKKVQGVTEGTLYEIALPPESRGVAG